MKSIKKEVEIPKGTHCDKYLIKKDKAVEIIHFDNVSHMCEAVEAAKDKSYLERDGRNNWTFGTEFPDLASTKEALYNGDVSKKTLEKIGEYRDSLMNLDAITDLMRMAETYKRKRVFRDEGAELCIDRVMASDPNHWSRMSPGKRQKVVRLATNYAVSCGHSEKQLNMLGALTTVAVDMLQRCGFAVEVLGVQIAHNVSRYKENNCDKEQGFTMKLKAAEEKLDISRIACIGIPGLFRAYGFSAFQNFLDGEVSSGLGKAEATSKEVKDLLGVEHMLEVKWVNGKEKAFLTDLLESVTGQVLETV